MKAVVDEGRWLATEPSTDRAQLEDRFRGGMKRGIVFLVLEEEDGSIGGSVGLHPGDGDGVWTLGMWVVPRLRGRGLGRRLLDAAVATARREGALKLELEVFTDNEPALELYRSAGFVIEDVRAGAYPREDGSVKSSVVMALSPGRAAERADSRTSLQSTAAVKRFTDIDSGADD
jgi:RimJ/RimL family protein N-acetyltransferase